MSKHNDRVLTDILAVSSGTLATLTGEKNYKKLDAIRNEFFFYVNKSKRKYKSWMDAWEDFEREVMPILKRVFKVLS